MFIINGLLKKNMIKEISELEKILIMTDLHVPYQDDKAIDCAIQYGKKMYKPDTIVINGDFLDFYSLSRFDKNPNRKDTVQDDLNMGKNYLEIIRKNFPKAKIYYLEGNHESRLKKYLYKNIELVSLEALKLENLLDLKKYKIEFVGSSPDYWKNKTDIGHLKLGDSIIMHGDNRLNGASTSKYSCYSIKNTIHGSTQSNTIIGHVHRLGMYYQSNPYNNIVGVESGCLCQISGTANWQQGFSTFEVVNDKSVNHKTYLIQNGVLMVDGKKINSRKKIKNPI